MDKKLFEAARDGHVVLVRRLLAEGVNTEWKDKVSQGIYIFSINNVHEWSFVVLHYDVPLWSC